MLAPSRETRIPRRQMSGLHNGVHSATGRHVATKDITLFFCWCEAYIWVLQTKYVCVGVLQSHKYGEAFTSRGRGRLDGRCLADLHSTRRAWAAIASHTAQPHGGLSVERHSRRTGHSLLHNANSDIPIDTKNGRGGGVHFLTPGALVRLLESQKKEPSSTASIDTKRAALTQKPSSPSAPQRHKHLSPPSLPRDPWTLGPGGGGSRGTLQRRGRAQPPCPAAKSTATHTCPEACTASRGRCGPPAPHPWPGPCPGAGPLLPLLPLPTLPPR